MNASRQGSSRSWREAIRGARLRRKYVPKRRLVRATHFTNIAGSFLDMARNEHFAPSSPSTQLSSQRAQSSLPHSRNSTGTILPVVSDRCSDYRLTSSDPTQGPERLARQDHFSPLVLSAPSPRPLRVAVDVAALLFCAPRSISWQVNKPWCEFTNALSMARLPHGRHSVLASPFRGPRPQKPPPGPIFSNQLTYRSVLFSRRRGFLFIPHHPLSVSQCTSSPAGNSSRKSLPLIIGRITSQIS